MCGLVGILHRGSLPDAPARIRAMASSIAHRGPDGEGFFDDSDIALGFRRLAIVDLETGHQPMANEDGAVRVVFNGEIYNHRELRAELEARGHRFATDHSDTEVLVHGWEEWGATLPARLNGMFAFAVWDHRQRTLLLARDRLGVKPLYLAEGPRGELLFASEIRALHASGLVAKGADPVSVSAYFQQQNVWGGRSLFAGVRHLGAGCILLDAGAGRRESAFWRIAFDRRVASREEAAEALRAVIAAAVQRQMAADVPVMSYLSGGIDSTAITAAARRVAGPGLSAYSCIFDLAQVGEDRFVDEREFSRIAARSLGIRHIELELPATALLGALRPTVDALEEPRMGMAYVNYLIAQRVARDGKVVLSGCGGDEILAGYVGRYAHVCPGSPAPRPGWRSWLDRLRGAPGVAASASARDRILAMLSFPVSQAELDTAFSRDFQREAAGYSLPAELDRILDAAPSDHPWDRLMYVDATTYLPGLLMVEDKLSMIHSLETRVPLLDNDVIDLSFTLGWDCLTDGRTGKIAFRDAIGDWVPPTIRDKPKMGFGPPDASWYRGALQPFIRAVLAPERIAARGILEPSFVAAALDAHMSGKANRLPLIWSLLSFEAWCDTHDLYGGDLGRPLERIAVEQATSAPA
jgi:asparagine synthase (glutamine-hydrolysing)